MVRDATVADLDAIVEIYNEVVATTTAIWRDDPISREDRAEWLDRQQREGNPVVVAVDDAEPGGPVIGFASYGPFRPWPGYALTVENSIHVASKSRGRGAGDAMMSVLIARAEARGVAVMIAGIDLDNRGSMRFHERFGFRPVGHLPGVGRKNGAALDLVFMQLDLEDPR